MIIFIFLDLQHDREEHQALFSAKNSPYILIMCLVSVSVHGELKHFLLEVLGIDPRNFRKYQKIQAMHNYA